MISNPIADTEPAWNQRDDGAHRYYVGGASKHDEDGDGGDDDDDDNDGCDNDSGHYPWAS